ncbi:hypothetical protein GCM10023191_056870 [Actinoallomurus oryzae]|uniref:Uncharacterized protein n=1 Tax=Actinoallomurus oryzae TaxID=502180 RepID=A0ABP8QIP9_9ACTN
MAAGAAAAGATLLPKPFAVAAAAAGTKGVMLMNRIGPSSSDLYISDIDGSNERKLLANPGFDYHAGIAADGRSLVFTSERTGDGNSAHYRARIDGTGLEPLVLGPAMNDCGTLSPDGTELAFVSTHGVLNLTTGATRVLTEEFDNLPDWSPDSRLILFTRKTSATNFDVCTIRPDGTDLRVLTSSGANDGHAVWNHDGRILYNSGMYGFRAGAALYDDTFQPYGQIFSMKADGSDKKLLTDSQWEDSMPLYLPRDVLSQ